MHASPACPFEHLHWTAEQLADAVPLRLHQIDLFDATDAKGRGALPAANVTRARLRIAHGYRSGDAMVPRFRIS